MKKNILIALFLPILLFGNQTYLGNCCSCFDLTVSSGYIWKDDQYFKEVYGSGLQDIITVDIFDRWTSCYGAGLKVSYWAANGKTTVLKRPTELEEIPLILYCKREIGDRCRFYGSLGVGGIFVNEKSYIGRVNKSAWCGEVEAGVNYYMCNNVYLTSAFRYIYSHKKINQTGDWADFGGYGIRGGLGFEF